MIELYFQHEKKFKVEFSECPPFNDSMHELQVCVKPGVLQHEEYLLDHLNESKNNLTTFAKEFNMISVTY